MKISIYYKMKDSKPRLRGLSVNFVFNLRNSHTRYLNLQVIVYGKGVELSFSSKQVVKPPARIFNGYH